MDLESSLGSQLKIKQGMGLKNEVKLNRKEMMVKLQGMESF